MIPVPARSDRGASHREVRSFDEGDLWCSDDAVPPLSPPGWYFRLARSANCWIGPFSDAGLAEGAPTTGDPLADARRYLDRWRRGEAPPPLKLVPRTRPAPLPPITPDGQFELAVSTEAAAVASAAPAPRRRAARAPQSQLSLPL